MSNLDLWDSVEKTDPKHTKSANVRGNKITAIAPQRQIKNATEKFGVYGETWGFKAVEFNYSLLERTGIIVFHGVFYFPNGEFPITSSISAFRDNAMTKPDADFAKKVETDALTKALSKLGFNADVFMGMYDDHKYVQMMQEEFNPSLSVNDLKKAIKESGWREEQVLTTFNPPLNSIDEIQDIAACISFLKANEVK